MKKSTLTRLTSVFAIILISAFGPLFLYLNNADEADFSEVLIPLLIFVVSGLVLFGLFLLLTRSGGKAALMAGVFVLTFFNFSLLERGVKLVFPELHYWHTVPIVILILLHIAYLLNRFLSAEISEDIASVLCVVFSVLIVINLVTGLPAAVARAQVLRAGAGQPSTSEGEQIEGGPNIYLCIFDEYANFPQMKKYYNYDNEVLYSFLVKHNFNISETGHNESIDTSTITTNLMNLEYIVNDSTPAYERDVARKNGKLFSILQECGYNVRIIESGSFFGQNSPVYQSEVSNSKTINGENIAEILLKRSILYPIANFSTRQSGQKESRAGQVTGVFNYLNEMEISPDSETFTLAYTVCPHTPFIFDKNGKYVSTLHWSDWQDSRYYLGQFQYVTQMMIKTVENILEKDSNAVIILQSDHGARGALEKNFSMEDMSCPFNAVYFQGKPLDIDGLSSVNTMRTVLNNLFGFNYDLIPLP